MEGGEGDKRVVTVMAIFPRGMGGVGGEKEVRKREERHGSDHRGHLPLPS